MNLELFLYWYLVGSAVAGLLGVSLLLGFYLDHEDIDINLFLIIFIFPCLGSWFGVFFCLIMGVSVFFEKFGHITLFKRSSKNG